MEFYSFLKVMLIIGNVEVKAFITDIGIELTNQLKEELRQANVTLGPTIYSQTIKTEDINK